jgi:uncharacterized protein (TIGR02391 family)
MVPIDFHQYRQQVKRALLAKKRSLDNEWDGFVAAWVAYALSQDGIANNVLLEELANRFEQWAGEDRSWESVRNLGPLAFGCWLQQKLGKPNDSTMVGRLSEYIKKQSADDKLGLLRDPEQVFLLALGLKEAEDAKAYVMKEAAEQAKKGPLRRRVLFAAAVRELGGHADAPAGDPHVGDVVLLVWWAERYDEQTKRDQEWQRFGSVRDMISIEESTAVESQRVLSVPELALLYEAVCRQAAHPEPMLLFEYFPLHPRVREIANSLFRNGEYVSAVFEACKVLKEAIERKSGKKGLTEVKLVEETMDIDLIRFNDRLSETSGKNEQKGLTMIFKGVFKAFRHPKGHEPKDNSLLQLHPYEALCQIVVISYLMNRVEEAIDP